MTPCDGDAPPHHPSVPQALALLRCALNYTRPHARADNLAIVEAIDALIVARLEERKRPATLAETVERIEAGR